MPALRRGRLGLAVAGAATLSLITTTAASAAVITSEDAVALGGAMSAVGVTGGALTVDYDCSGIPCPTGISDSALAGFPTSGGTFGIITSGDAGLADDPNSDDGSGEGWSQTGTPIAGDVWDQQVLRLDLPAASGELSGLRLPVPVRGVPRVRTSGYNDAFVAQLDTWNVTVDPAAQKVNAPGDFAAGAGDRISVDAAGPSAMYAAQAAGTTYDGATLGLVARTAVAPGSVHSLYLTMFDQGDAILDSAVFVDNIRFENLPAGQCKSLALDPYEATTGVTLAGTPAFGASNTVLNIPVSCNLPPGPDRLPDHGDRQLRELGRHRPGRTADGHDAAGQRVGDDPGQQRGQHRRGDERGRSQGDDRRQAAAEEAEEEGQEAPEEGEEAAGQGRDSGAGRAGQAAQEGGQAHQEGQEAQEAGQEAAQPAARHDVDPLHQHEEQRELGQQHHPEALSA